MAGQFNKILKNIYPLVNICLTVADQITNRHIAKEIKKKKQKRKIINYPFFDTGR